MRQHRKLNYIIYSNTLELPILACNTLKFVRFLCLVLQIEQVNVPLGNLPLTIVGVHMWLQLLHVNFIGFHWIVILFIISPFIKMTDSTIKLLNVK